MILFLSAWLGFSLPAATDALCRDGAALVQDADRAYEALEDEYEAVAYEWKRELREAEKSGPEAEAAVRARNPVKDFYPRFAGLVEQGNSRAAFWMATRVEFVESDSAKVEAAKKNLYANAIRGLAATKEADEILKALRRDETLGAPLVESLYFALATATQDAEVASKALLERGKSLFDRATSDEEREKAVAALEELLQLYPESRSAKNAEGQVFEYRNLRVGCVAPDFTTQDVDGAEFKLSDYRGKVVLIDFWGFW